jgi:ABC-type lipoprotein release transport system permease subunit
MSGLNVLLLIALRNIATHRLTSFIVGSIILFGTFLVVVGTSLLDSIELSMMHSITSSFVGDIQISAADGRDALELFGNSFMGENDVGEMRDYAAVEKAVTSVPHVRAIVPMGITLPQILGGNVIDDVLEDLRHAIAKKDEKRIDALIVRLKSIASDLADAAQRTREIVSTKTVDEALADLQKVKDDAFWAGLKTDPESTVLWLDTHLAPLYEESQLFFLRVIGTDLDRFTSLFDRFKMVRGEPVPPHTRGLLLSDLIYEKWLKNRVAAGLDRLKRERDNKGHTIATDADLADLAKHLPEQAQRVTFALDALAVDEVASDLQRELGHPGTLGDLVREVITVTDETLDERARIFYAVIAPHMRLYPMKVGETVTLRAFTKSGYQKSVNVKLYGTFAFEGLESSDLAGSTSLIDMMSFRDLYGSMTADRRQELAGIRNDVGLADISRGSAEDQLFGGSAAVVSAEASRSIEGIDLRGARRDAEQMSQAFDPAEITNGLALNAAVLLDSEEHLRGALTQVEKATKDAGVPVKAISWQAASGLVGQFVLVVRLVLLVAIGIMFLVALVIINNSMVMATVERVSEIGTMRAIGAQRGFVMRMFFIETVVLGLIAGTAGLIAGSAAVMWMGKVGIPAGNDVLAFLFSGPRLYPTVGVPNLVIALVTIVVVSVLSTLYPARIATRIQPVVAMQTKE